MATDAEHGGVRLDMVLIAVIILVVALLQFRMLSFLFLALLLILYGLRVRLRRKWCLVAVASFFLASLFLPVDVALGSYYWGRRIGSSPGGPHLVRFVVGLPARNEANPGVRGVHQRGLHLVGPFSSNMGTGMGLTAPKMAPSVGAGTDVYLRSLRLGTRATERRRRGGSSYG